MDGSRQGRRATRIADVAALAGVSTATVSRALTDPTALRPETLARVSEAVRSSGYTPNVAARNLRARRTMVVLVVVPDIANPFFADVLRGIDEELSAHGYGLLIGNLARTRKKEPHLVGIVQSGQVDGVILLNGRVPQGGAHALSDTGVPLVAVCEAIPGASFPQVEAQNREAAREAVAHLVGLGHRRLAYVSGPKDNILERERRAGFLEGLAAAGIERKSAPIYPGDFTFAAGEKAAESYLAAERRPTAVFAANDEMAIGFLKSVRAAGIAVPDQLSVIGFDGIAFADYVEPTLTTFRQPRRALGKAGAALLISQMTGVEIAPEDLHVRLEVPLVVRDSTGTVPL